MIFTTKTKLITGGAIFVALLAGSFGLHFSGIKKGRNQVREQAAQQQAQSTQNQLERERGSRQTIRLAEQQIATQRGYVYEAINNNKKLDDWRQTELPLCVRILSGASGVSNDHPCFLHTRPDADSAIGNQGRSSN